MPCAEYAKVFDLAGRIEYERLLSKAVDTEVLPLVTCDDEAYFSAGKKVIDISDLVIAVWNGRPASGLGGTGDVVEYARFQEKRYVHVNPATRKTMFFRKRRSPALLACEFGPRLIVNEIATRSSNRGSTTTSIWTAPVSPTNGLQGPNRQSFVEGSLGSIPDR